MKNFISFLGLGIIVAWTTLSMAQNANFADVSSSHPHHEAIAYVKSEGIVSGYPDGTFRPDASVNRVELLKILQEAEYPESPSCQKYYDYSDVDWSAWYGGYLQVASCLGIVEGYPDGRFGPGNSVKVTEGAKIISEAFTHEVDSDGASVWYYPYLDNLGDRRVIPRTITSVDGELTRGQMAEMIYRLKENITNQSFHNRATLLAAQAIQEGQPEKIYETYEDAWVEITTDDRYRYVKGNGLANHATGTFPNRANPNAISEQEVEFRMTLNPSHDGSATWARLPGVAVNGVKFEPETAERYQNTDWKYEAIQAGVPSLGLDSSYAHVQPDGTYHYHAVPTGLVEKLAAQTSTDTLLVGYAADGYKMYYSQSGIYEPSYRIKSGTRPDGPGGTYNGTFTQDFEYVEGLGDLDECNGKWVNGEYRYYLTDDFPYIPRCLQGTSDSSFTQGGPGGGQPGVRNQSGQSSGGEPDLSEAAEKLGVTVQQLQRALGPPPPDFTAAAQTLGVSESYLRSIMPAPPR